MRRWQLTLGLLLLAAPMSQAHHIWIVPENPFGSKARAYFGDNLEPGGDARTLAKVAHTKLWMRDSKGEETPLNWEKGEGGYDLVIPGKGFRTVAGVCPYGIVGWDHRLQKSVDPYLLMYYPKTIVGDGDTSRAWERLPLEIMPALSPGKLRLRVLFKGKPSPNAEMMVQTPGATQREALKTDERGEIVIEVKTAGTFALQTRYIETTAGEHKGTKYQAIRHYASLVLVQHVSKEQTTSDR